MYLSCLPLLDYVTTGTDAKLFHVQGSSFPIPEMDNIGMELLPFGALTNGVSVVTPGNNVGTIFSITLIDEIPEDATFCAFGMDYGYSIDPTTLVTVSRKDTNLYLDELLFKTIS